MESAEETDQAIERLKVLAREAGTSLMPLYKFLRADGYVNPSTARKLTNVMRKVPPEELRALTDFCVGVTQ